MSKIKCSEHASRITYLYQAAELVVSLAPTVSQHFGEVMGVISEKTPAKLDYTLKRTICKKCKQILVLGKNASYRLKRRKRGKSQKVTGRKAKSHPTQIITCQTCQTVKSIPTNPNYKLFEKTSNKMAEKQGKRCKEIKSKKGGQHEKSRTAEKQNIKKEETHS